MANNNTILFDVLFIYLKLNVLKQYRFNTYCCRLRILSCMPPPVSSAVILTKAVGGNEVNTAQMLQCSVIMTYIHVIIAVKVCIRNFFIVCISGAVLHH